MKLALSAMYSGEEVSVCVSFDRYEADPASGCREYLEIDTILLGNEQIDLPEDERERLIDQAWSVIDRRRDALAAKREDAWEARNVDQR